MPKCDSCKHQGFDALVSWKCAECRLAVLLGAAAYPHYEEKNMGLSKSKCPLIDCLDLSCKEEIEKAIDKLKNKLEDMKPPLRNVECCGNCRHKLDTEVHYVYDRCIKHERNVDIFNVCHDWKAI